MTVLVVEDEDDVREILAEEISAHGLKCLQAKNGHEAIDMVLGNKVDLVITDFRMPKLDGLEFIRKIRGDGYTMPILVMTGFTNHTMETFLRAGASEFFEKPLDIEALIERIVKLLKKN